MSHDQPIQSPSPSPSHTALAFRVWRYNPGGTMLLSVTSGGFGPKPNWVVKALAAPEGAWPHSRSLVAACRVNPPHEDAVPGADCTCGIYAARDLEVIDGYLSTDVPVLGIVHLGGRVIPATQGFRAAKARVAAVLKIDPVLTLPHAALEAIAAAYRVPALVPHSTSPEDYRGILDAARAEQGITSLGDEAEAWLAAQSPPPGSDER